MDYDLILPAIAATSVILVVIQKLCFKIRTKFPITVNCWFCSFNTRVPYNSSNAWYCPQCDQYNGFSPDGSYNRLLPEQFSEKLNCNFWCVKTKQTTPDTASNGLCRFCNINLELKVQQLAQFVPFNKENYDEEVQQYSEQLERVYRLCLRCQNVVEKTLDKKYDKYVRNQTLTTTLEPSCSQYLQPKEKQHNSVYVTLTAFLSAGLLLSVMPYHWTDHLLATYPPPDYIIQVVHPVKEYLPKGGQSTVVLCLGSVVQLLDYARMRDTTSFVNLLIWIVLLSLTQVKVHIDGLLSIVYMLAGIVFFVTSITQGKNIKPKNVATVKPVQLHKLGGNSERTKGSANFCPTDPVCKPVSPKCPVSDSNLAQPPPSPIRESTPEDFGFAKLNVSSTRVTRSQTRHFQTKMFGCQPQTDLFKPKPVNLTPPKLQLDKASEYQVPLTRSSSQSSGFVSLSHQKDFEDSRSPSVLGDNIDSISQCGGGAMTTYHSPFVTPTTFTNPYGLPFSNFPPYTIMSFTPPQFDKFYQYSLSPYEPSLSLSSYTMHKNVEQRGWFQCVKNILFSFVCLLVITTHIAVLWKVYGEQYFSFKATS